MPKKAVLLFTLLTLTACFLSYRLGSAPVALAKAPPAQQDMTDRATPPPLPTAPATWALINGGGNITGVVSVTKPAGGTGVRHVATCITATYSNNGAPAGTIANLSLVDGNPGSGTALLIWGLEALSGSSSSVNLCDLNVVGAANTPMTLEISDHTNSNVTLNLVGYDAQ